MRPLSVICTVALVTYVASQQPAVATDSSADFRLFPGANQHWRETGETRISVSSKTTTPPGITPPKGLMAAPQGTVLTLLHSVSTVQTGELDANGDLPMRVEFHRKVETTGASARQASSALELDTKYKPGSAQFEPVMLNRRSAVGLNEALYLSAMGKTIVEEVFQGRQDLDGKRLQIGEAIALPVVGQIPFHILAGVPKETTATFTMKSLVDGVAVVDMVSVLKMTTKRPDMGNRAPLVDTEATAFSTMHIRVSDGFLMRRDSTMHSRTRVTEPNGIETTTETRMQQQMRGEKLDS